MDNVPRLYNAPRDKAPISEEIWQKRHSRHATHTLIQERLRIPVGKSRITRTLVGNLTARAFNEHVPQTNGKISSGDKVFW